MEKLKRIDEFLKLIAEISKSGIEVDSNLVYSNLICIGTTKENTNGLFELWQRNFERIRNVSVFVADNWKYFCQFKGHGSKTISHHKIKLYVPLDLEHIYNGVNELFTFLSENNIPHLSKVASHTRFDDVVLNVDDIDSVELIRNYVNNNKNIKEGLILPNPFAFTDGNISITWDGNLSYNTVVSEWVSDYINETRLKGTFDNVSYRDFYVFLQRKYSEIFVHGNGINDIYQTRMYVNSEEDVLDYKYVTEILIMSLNPRYTLEDFYRKIDMIKNPDKEVTERKNVKKLLQKERNKPTQVLHEQKEVFDYVYIEMAKKDSPQYAMNCFKHFVNDGNYRIFTRTNNIRDLLMSSNITPEVMKEMIYEEQKNALINASLETMKKYDISQAIRAIFEIKNGNYSFFTNENNARRDIKILIEPTQIDEIIRRITAEEGYTDLDTIDSYWVFIELIKINFAKIR